MPTQTFATSGPVCDLDCQVDRLVAAINACDAAAVGRQFAPGVRMWCAETGRELRGMDVADHFRRRFAAFADGPQRVHAVRAVTRYDGRECPCILIYEGAVRVCALCLEVDDHWRIGGIHVVIDEGVVDGARRQRHHA